jgi:CRISPR-associated protein (TIGR03984 family)
MSKRELFATTAICEKIDDLAGFASDPTSWLSGQMQARKLNYLLAHADDGVIWGRLDDEGLVTSHEVAPEYSPLLRAETLQTARIFAPAGELFVWRDEEGAWMARLIAEPETTPGTSPAWTRAFEEAHIVWGTEIAQRERDFTLMSEGTQGLMHVVPLKVGERIDEEHRPLRLVVRHYVKANENGFLRVDASRLHSLRLQTKESTL